MTSSKRQSRRRAPAGTAVVDNGESRARSRRSSPQEADEGEPFVAAWRTTHRVTVYLVERLPPAIWEHTIPGQRRSVRALAAHIHNARCMWIKSLGARHGVPVPAAVDIRRVAQKELVRALAQSSDGMIRLIRLGAINGGVVPRAIWQNFPTDLPHFLSYFVAHEAHHRGQLVIIARELGHRLPRDVTGGLWQWIARRRE